MNKETFFKLLFSCIKITTNRDHDSIFYYYDQKLIRKNKLNSILDNKKNNINIDIDIDNILFEQDLKNKHLWIKYDKIWRKIEEHYNTNYNETKEMIEGWLNDDTNWKQYTSILMQERQLLQLNDDTNWKQYTSVEIVALNDDTNWKQYTSDAVQVCTVDVEANTE